MSYVDYTTGQFDLTFAQAPDPDQPLDVSYFFGEPSAVDRLAAIEDPDGEAAQRVKAWEDAKEMMANLTKASDEIYKRTKKGPNWIRASPKVMHSVLGGVQVTC
jgi:hypothetical protein